MKFPFNKRKKNKKKKKKKKIEKHYESVDKKA